MKPVIKKLLDEKNNDDVMIYVDGKEVPFAQVANINCDGELYTLLVPLEKLEGVGEDEGVLFQFVTYKDDIEIEMVTDLETIDKVYLEYLNMLEE